MDRFRIASAAALVSLAGAAAAAADDRRLGAHLHGEGTLNIAVEGKLVEIELAAPGMDIVGFEHAATSAEDRAAIDAARARLAEGETLFEIPAGAGCDLERSDTELLADAHQGESHTEFLATWRFGCADPDRIDEIVLRYFELFPGAERLSVQIATRRGSTGLEVGPERPVVPMAGGS